MLEIRKIEQSDAEAVWNIFQEVVTEGNAFCSDESVTKEKALQNWITPDTYVAYMHGEIVGAYVLFPLHHGRGSHIADLALMVSSRHRGKGVGLTLAKHALKEARKMGYIAMEFICH